jgi:hypothetical protein
MQLKALIGPAAVVSVALSLTAARDVRACMHAGVFIEDGSTEDLLRAEQKVAKGDYAGAARGVAIAFPGLRKRRLHSSILSDRAVRVMAQSVVRTRGDLDLGALFPGATEAQRNQNIEWSVHVLQGLSLKRRDDPVALSSVAEAFALVPGKRPDAKRILVELENKDVLSTPQAFATLAELRESAGEGRPAFLRHPLRSLEQARASVARARCKVMTDDATLCERPSA